MTVDPVRTSADLDAFLRLPWSIYKDDPNWVPPLLAAERKLLDRAKNPFWRHAEAEHFLARRNGRIVGRVSAIVNRRHNEFHPENAAHFGFYECERDPATAKELFAAAEAWAAAKGMAKMIGPANPSMNDTCGLLVDGFQWSPFVLMTYNPRYYVEHVEAAGYRKAMDLIAYIILQTDVERKKIDRVAAIVEKRSEVRIRRVSLSRFRKELAIVNDIYNDAWERNWGFVPATPEEIEFTANDLKSVLLPEYVHIAEIRGEPVGFALALPDINHALKKCDGTLWPFGWWWFLKFNLRKIPTYRVVALGIRKKYQHLGIGTLFYKNFFDEAIRRGHTAAEMSWILETNEAMNKPIVEMGGKAYKTYRMYEKAIGLGP